jgi:hypothetical protein
VEQEAMDALTKVKADDVTSRVDTGGEGISGTRNVNGGESAPVEQEAMAAGAPSTVAADDVTPRVDTVGEGLCGAGDINGGERELKGLRRRDRQPKHT